tara:strand:- start:279 stop:668 length:390 start_codon:yes stop_codon:yes gene_type:complete
MSKTTLTFRSNKSLRKLAQETLNSDEFRLPYSEEATKDKGFFLVKDDGIYLMNAFKAKNKKTPLENGYVIYAVGYNPKTNDDVWEKSRWAVGGDDFGNFIPFDIPQLERIAEGGNISIKVFEDSWGVTA